MIGLISSSIVLQVTLLLVLKLLLKEIRKLVVQKKSNINRACVTSEEWGFIAERRLLLYTQGA